MTAGADQGCQLYLVTPGGLASALALEAFAADLKAALGAGQIGAVLLRTAGLNGDAARRAAEALGPLARARDVAFLIEDRPEVAEAANADGVHLTDPRASVAETRAQVGPEAIVGVACGASRHDAIEAAEAGADYVAFAGPEDALEELLSWWQETMTPPCVAFGAGDLETALRQGRAGADFLALDDAVWNHPEGPAAAVAVLTEGLAAWI